MAPDFITKKLNQRVVELRRYFHQTPEVGFKEKKTSEFILNSLEKVGYECQSGVGGTGVVAKISNGVGKTLLIRADMDGLPVDEETSLKFASQNGVMHACGHDSHMAIALTVAEYIAENLDSIKGTLAFVFQPAEELGAGAAAMVKDGFLKKLKPDRVMGLHIWNQEDSGLVLVNDGLAFGGAGMFSMKVIGKGGHGAAPESAIDPVPVAAQIIVALQTIVSREFAPKDNVALTVGSIHAGMAGNVIPKEVALRGTLRATDVEGLQKIKQSITRIAKSTAQALRAEVEIDFGHGLVPPVINDKNVTDWFKEIASEVAGKEKVLSHAPLTGSEDMSEFLNRVPGVFFLLAAGPKEYPHHNSKFDFDESALPLGVEIFTQCTLRYLR